MTNGSIRDTDAADKLHSHREAMRKQTREEAESIVKLAGFAIHCTWELANGYWPDAPCYDEVRKPWWLFMTERGPIQIGWRKRVLALDWEGSKMRRVVTADEVTKSETGVHAYSVAKAVEYLGELRRSTPEAA